MGKRIHRLLHFLIYIEPDNKCKITRLLKFFTRIENNVLTLHRYLEVNRLQTYQKKHYRALDAEHLQGVGMSSRVNAFLFIGIVLFLFKWLQSYGKRVQPIYTSQGFFLPYSTFFQWVESSGKCELSDKFEEDLDERREVKFLPWPLVDFPGDCFDFVAGYPADVRSLSRPWLVVGPLILHPMSTIGRLFTAGII